MKLDSTEMVIIGLVLMLPLPAIAMHFSVPLAILSFCMGFLISVYAPYHHLKPEKGEESDN